MLLKLQSSPPPEDLPFSVDPRAVNILVGCVALFLPLALAVTALTTNTCFMTSISHFYYTRIGGDILVGGLSVIGLTLIMFYRFKGETVEDHDAYNARNAFLAKLAGVFALGVAFIPTGHWGCQYTGQTSRFILNDTRASGSIYDPATGVEGAATNDFWNSFGIWADGAAVPGLIYNLHYISAAGMFLILGYFSYFVFTGVQTLAAREGKDLTREKMTRNMIYRIMGVLIFIAVLALGVKLGLVEWVLAPEKATRFKEVWDGLWLTFTFETVALVAFGISWMVKGRFMNWLTDPPA